ncbi:MAG: zinc ABC transporter substrate-binding protein [Geodermatophilaceae bacterium]|nr:zinc ABC transporter substrate-binding protein [Geodermatophilaceae bacterium]
MKQTAVLGLGCAATLLVGGCGSEVPQGAPGPLEVVVGFYPLQYLAETIGGDNVTVSSLAQPGAEPHDLELSPQQVEEVVTADVVLFLGSFQPAVDNAVEQGAADSAFDVLGATETIDGYEELGEQGEDPSLDPHVWLDPTRFAAIATAVGERFAELDPANADGYTANAETLLAQLEDLDERFSEGLADCARTDIVVTHNAFGYLADRYGLTQVGIAGLSPEEEPSPQKLDDVRQFAEENGLTTIFYEEAVSPEYAQTVADLIGASTAVLSPLEVVDDGEDYVSVMEQNLTTLEAALGCG